MSEVIEHLRRPEQAIAACVSLLAPGGVLLLTTPNGHWESDEHLHEFTLESFGRLLAASGGEGFSAEYLRDRDNRRRWLSGRVFAAATPHAPDSFNDRLEIARLRANRK